MNEMDELYLSELKDQEIRANKRTLLGYLWCYGVIAVVWLLTILGVFNIDWRPVTVAFALTSIIFLVPGYIFKQVDLSNAWVKYCLLTFICVVTGTITSILSVHATLLYVMPIIFAIQYRRKKPLWFTYAMTAVTMVCSCLNAFFFGICDLNILLKSNHTRGWYLEHYANGALILEQNENPAFIVVAYEVFPRLLILLIFTVMLRYMLVNNNEDAERIAQLTCSKETDTCTKLYNKNKYEEMLSEYYPAIDKIAVFFCDLNNLKVVNDKYGHIVGDLLIESMSKILYSYNSERCRAYRVGGDEFLVIVDNPEAGEIGKIINSLKSQIDTTVVREGVALSCAVGYAEGEGKEIKNVIKIADERMYLDKTRCKMNQQKNSTES